MSSKLFVGSLPWSVNDESLQAAFEPYGSVLSAKVIMDKQTGKSRGFGFVEMESETDAANAIKALNNSDMKGRTIVVNEAKPKS